MKTKLLAVLSAAVLLLATISLWAQTVKPTQAFMRQKLVYSQGILEGVTLEKYDLILTNVAPLRDMNSTNAFLLLGNPDYMEKMTNFQKAADALNVAARNKDIDSASKAYVSLTEGCIDCHKLFRREQFQYRFKSKQ